MTQRDEAGSIVVQVGTVTVKMSPVGFALYAEEFLKAGESIPADSQARGNTTFTPVPYYMFCRALELILKAFLLTKDRTLDELKNRYGHNLEKLWRGASDLGLSEVVGACAPSFEADLASANSYYKGKAFEYFDFRRWARGYQGLPPLPRFRDEVRKIVEKTKKFCFDVS
jgi:hypothetical protein